MMPCMYADLFSAVEYKFSNKADFFLSFYSFNQKENFHRSEYVEIEI